MLRKQQGVCILRLKQNFVTQSFLFCVLHEQPRIMTSTEAIGLLLLVAIHIVDHRLKHRKWTSPACFIQTANSVWPMMDSINYFNIVVSHEFDVAYDANSTASRPSNLTHLSQHQVLRDTRSSIRQVCVLVSFQHKGNAFLQSWLVDLLWKPLASCTTTSQQGPPIGETRQNCNSYSQGVTRNSLRLKAGTDFDTTDTVKRKVESELGVRGWWWGISKRVFCDATGRPEILARQVENRQISSETRTGSSSIWSVWQP